MEMTRYYDEFLRYWQMASTQQELCNLGDTPHEDVGDCDLMKHVHLYDVVQRKYAGFGQILLDVWYGESEDHPYHGKADESVERTLVRKANGQGWRCRSGVDFLHLCLIHRLTGSGINYAKKPSGYHNSLLMHIDIYTTPMWINRLVDSGVPMYTSGGYQFPRFPKNPDGGRGGDYFIKEYSYDLTRGVWNFLLRSERPPTMREVGDYMFAWNKERGLVAYKFQYAAFIADIADYFPEMIDVNSRFYYGTNAIECLNYLADGGPRNTQDRLDAIMERIQADTGMRDYDAEDVACDFIRWVENYVQPGDAYDHLDRDRVWNNSTIKDHPFGRQRRMLELGLLDSFNDINRHPSDDMILRENGMTVEDYRNA